MIECSKQLAEDKVGVTTGTLTTNTVPRQRTVGQPHTEIWTIKTRTDKYMAPKRLGIISL